MAEELERQEADRKLQAEKLKNKLEVGNWALPFLADFFRKAESGILFNFHPCCTQEDKKEQENGIVTMFERLKGENEVGRRKIRVELFKFKLQVRKNEIHGLKDILVRENEKIQREQVTPL